MSRFASIDIVRLRWFVAVAEELHFARAAKALHISRQKLSHTVIELENELGTKLFVPGAHPTELTEDGAQLLGEAKELIARADAEQAAPEPVEASGLRVGFVPGVTVSKWQRIWGERFPGIPLELSAIAQADQLTALAEGRVDMCFVRLPIADAGLNAIPLYREVPVVVVPKEHPISVFAEVTTADLAEERQQDTSDLDQAAGSIELVAAGVGVTIVPHSIARLHARRDVVYRTVTDVPATEIALAWPSDTTTELVEEFIGVVRGRSERSSRSPSTDRPDQKKAARTGKKTQAADKNPAAGKARASGGRAGAKKTARRRGR
ncbi:LysR family transcriptional regulator [Nocardia cyriacigeorgica]|uniref:LysR family transcriptional regulator n=1 Tax=Nocardia cyriacigeorgica TaxID=135487 RepID=UPI0013B7ACFC|nr:LysR substrate-binding domain-containing protein [Nocardia cyriacigeorgica]NEW49164.1 LysR family transcriptional regulator [Nocardia cyriacigeorgica]